MLLHQLTINYNNIINAFMYICLTFVLKRVIPFSLIIQQLPPFPIQMLHNKQCTLPLIFSFILLVAVQRRVRAAPTSSSNSHHHHNQHHRHRYPLPDIRVNKSLFSLFLKEHRNSSTLCGPKPSHRLRSWNASQSLTASSSPPGAATD
jgi:hypothetical protein